MKEVIDMKKYYAEIARLGRDRTTILEFDSKAERDEFINTTDYTNAVYATKENKERAITLAEYNYQF